MVQFRFSMKKDGSIFKTALANSFCVTSFSHPSLAHEQIVCRLTSMYASYFNSWSTNLSALQAQLLPQPPCPQPTPVPQSLPAQTLTAPAALRQAQHHLPQARKGSAS
jgi:hypothetical protein